MEEEKRMGQGFRKDITGGGEVLVNGLRLGLKEVMSRGCLLGRERQDGVK